MICNARKPVLTDFDIRRETLQIVLSPAEISLFSKSIILAYAASNSLNKTPGDFGKGERACVDGESGSEQLIADEGFKDTRSGSFFDPASH